MNFVQHPLKIFGLNGSVEYAEKVVEELREMIDDLDLSQHIEKDFEDGECYAKSADGRQGNVRGHNCFVIQSLFTDSNLSVSDRFMRLCIFCGSLRSASANEVIPVIPHMAWARQDRKTASRAPVTTKIISSMLEACGVDRVLFFDVHNKAAEENAFSLRVPTDNLEAKSLHAEWAANYLRDSPKIVVLSPDSGGVQRAERFRTALIKKLKLLTGSGENANWPLAVFDKMRRENGDIQGANIVGDVENADVLLYDDMISTSGTMVKASKAVSRFGGKVSALMATHGIFVGNANRILHEVDAKIVVTDTIPDVRNRLDDENREKLVVVTTTTMVAQAIRKINSGTGSLSELIS